MAGLTRKIETVRQGGRNFSLVIVAEGARLADGETVGLKRDDGGIRLGGIGHQIGQFIEEATGAETRVTVLGHVQRGGAPSPRDRLFASAFGVRAVDLVAAGAFDRLVVWSNRACSDIPLEEAIRANYAVDPDGTLAHTARGLGIYLGASAAPGTA